MEMQFKLIHKHVRNVPGFDKRATKPTNQLSFSFSRGLQAIPPLLQHKIKYICGFLFLQRSDLSLNSFFPLKMSKQHFTIVELHHDGAVSTLTGLTNKPHAP